MSAAERAARLGTCHLDVVATGRPAHWAPPNRGSGVDSPSLPTLPLTLRDGRARYVGYTAGAVVFLVGSIAMFLDEGGSWYVWLLLAGSTVGTVFFGMCLLRPPRITLDVGGVRSVSPGHRFHVPWSAVEAFWVRTTRHRWTSSRMIVFRYRPDAELTDDDYVPGPVSQAYSVASGIDGGLPSTGGYGRDIHELAQLLERLRVRYGAPAGGASAPDAGPGAGDG
ncbi:hypothetical protein FTX61_13440 [Nitriliruptoraceae bacterium ZYF776]|nr:hypothetical protein [Profundirhabdus halotolerans]